MKADKSLSIRRKIINSVIKQLIKIKKIILLINKLEYTFQRKED